jgi:molybdate transport system permease protein
MNIDLSPLYLSLKVSFFATLICILIGLPLSYLLAKKRFYGRGFLDSIIMLPMILPPTVLGYYLLVVLGRRSFIGRAFEDIFGTTIVFTWYGAVIAASVVAIPLLVKTAKSAFEAVDNNLENAARILGKSETAVILTITIPLAWRGIFAGIALSFFRALGDFGTTLMVAGNIPGLTQTVPIAIYDAVQADNMPLANILVAIVTVSAISILLIMGRIVNRQDRREML